ncbi:MAG: CotH kinase family protein, partial [Planctomycetales bacterium]|nr:CotH kinase family protein [Planctomycetales bacterium]
KLLAVPKLRRRYLRCVRTLAEESLAWENIGPIVERLRDAIDDDVAADTRKLSSFDAFVAATSSDAAAKANGRDGDRNLRRFMEERCKYLLEHPAVRDVKPLKSPRRTADRDRPID